MKPCHACAHMRLRAKAVLFSSADVRSSSGLKASLDQFERERELRLSEDQLCREGGPFPYEPMFYPWCSAATPHDPKIVKAVALARKGGDASEARKLARKSVERGMELIKQAEAGSSTAIDQLASDGRAAMNPVTGEIVPLFALCVHLNPEFDCPLFTAKPTLSSTPAVAASTAMASKFEPEAPTQAAGLVPAPDPSPALAHRSDAMTNERIVAEGSVELGRELGLRQVPVREEERRNAFDGGRAIGMTHAEYARAPRGASDLGTQRLEYRLEPAGSPLRIENDGLLASYGIFGTSGSGKTHLLMHLLGQVLALHAHDPERKFGALIVDPKADLIDRVTTHVRAIGRMDDLVVLNTDLFHRAQRDGKHGAAVGVNVIQVAMDPYELGMQLVMSAQAAGAVGTSDPFWMLAWSNIFGAALQLLKIDGEEPSLQLLVDEILTEDTSLLEPKRLIELRAERMMREVASHSASDARDARNAIAQLSNFARLKDENARTVNEIIVAAYGAFQRSRFACFSHCEPGRASLYDEIIEHGKIVLVSLSPQDPTISKTLCALVKNLFQRAVLARKERYRAGTLSNFVRPLVIAADEYGQVACELEGRPIGDGDFFSLARQFGCMGLLATQSVNVLKASALKDNWRSVFSNLGAKIFMRLADNETVEEAVKLAGESEYYVTSQGSSHSKDGLSSSRQRDLRERKNLPNMLMTQVFTRGQAAVLGSLDGNKTTPRLRFLTVPDDPPLVRAT